MNTFQQHSSINKVHIEVENLCLGYEDYLVLKDISFKIHRSNIFIIMGGSGCGKSTLLKHMIGLIHPIKGKIYYDGVDFLSTEGQDRNNMLRRFGVLYQAGALWSTMTLRENVAFPIEQFTKLPKKEIRSIADLKLRLVGLNGFEDFYPAQISGGMRKRTALARAMALDPEILFFDEPSSGLDPVTARNLDKLILQIRDAFGTTLVIVSHDLDSILNLGDDSIFIDIKTKTISAHGHPKHLKTNSPNPAVQQFMNAQQIINSKDIFL